MELEGVRFFEDSLALALKELEVVPGYVRQPVSESLEYLKYIAPHILEESGKAELKRGCDHLNSLINLHLKLVPRIIFR